MQQKEMSLADYVIAVLFGVTITAIATQVFFRYVLNSSLTWTEELSRYLFTWIIFLGAALAIKNGAHITVDFFINKMPPKLAECLRLFSYGLILAFLILITVLGFMLVYHTANTRSPALSLPVNYVYYAALPVTMLLAVYYIVKKLISMVQGQWNKGKKEAA